MQIGFIGAGKVGTNLARYFFSKGFTIAGFYSRNYAHAAESSQQTNSRAFASSAECIQASDWLFITVPDDQLTVVWAETEPFVSAEQSIFHCSGVKSSHIFTSNKNVACFSLHPLLAFANKNMPLNTIAEAAFTLEGARNLEETQKILASLGNPVALIAAEDKALYHAACVFASNFVVGLSSAAEELFLDCGLPKNFAQTAWHQLFFQNAKNILAMSPNEALSGPVERNDLSTVNDHLAALPPEASGIYRELSKKLIQMASDKHSERDYQPMERALDQ